MQKGHDPRRNLGGRPRLNVDQREALAEMRRWTPAAIAELKRRLIERPDSDTARWLSVWDRWAAYTLGRPGDMEAQRDAAPETTADSLEGRWEHMGAEDRVRDLENLIPIVTAALEKARADLADETRDEPAALLAEGDAE